ncbi:hypothetical protein [Paenibacillus bouchesdurhonensis]|uniref:hypothetical protein n=1 Tax=Paenibacillus bouchesdurhonensis TaxID=1870990 RepID=UPI000DA60D31|nr:hypothetical protein [Paenibacillus bouchesdurhonensis]
MIADLYKHFRLFKYNHFSVIYKSKSMDAGIHIFDPMHRTTGMIKLDTNNEYGILLVKYSEEEKRTTCSSFKLRGKR